MVGSPLRIRHNWSGDYRARFAARATADEDTKKRIIPDREVTMRIATGADARDRQWTALTGPTKSVVKIDPVRAKEEVVMHGEDARHS